jgi:hypothetical protein
VGRRARGARRGSGETVRPGFGKSVRQSVRHLFGSMRRFENVPMLARKPEQGDFFCQRAGNDRLMQSSVVLSLRERRKSEAGKLVVMQRWGSPWPSIKAKSRRPAPRFIIETNALAPMYPTELLKKA